MNQDVATIAKGLTKAQRKIILWADPSGALRELGKGEGSTVSCWALMKVVKGDPTKEVAQVYSLVTKGKGSTKPRHMWPQDTWGLTPLGLAVRAHLQGQSS
jgi:hypothetical protein